MSRLLIAPIGTANGFMDKLVDSFERRIQATPPDACAVGTLLGFLQACKAQTCGKYTSCSRGIPLLEESLQLIVAFKADGEELETIAAFKKRTIPFVIALNKTDLASAATAGATDRSSSLDADAPLIPLSATTGAGIEELKEVLVKLTPATH